ncbi:DUF523 domain-containing protein [Thalassotalea marina]|uniref:DUF523 domain-containing protein n=1 Tax=Thalassotalea marina TaxID=1673741 RepID=A0A919EK52_9GAMM|nr:DUF523 domain-containing protein [Thalassotalea marina]GHF88945.1 hypothetical protein GCM10017161_15900 [Thalassotalea marina]
MDKILVSACLMGHCVRYDGGHQKLLSQTIDLWQKQQRLVVLCPEVAGGLLTPRPPAEIQSATGQVMDIEGNDVSDAFNRGAQMALSICQQHQIRYALLKESSPSCGGKFIYNGEFSGSKIPGSGITAKLLKQHGVRVYGEQDLNDLIKMVNQN